MNEDNLYSLKQQNTILVQMARNGDRQALTELFEQLYQPLLNYLYHMLGDRQQAEDLGQDAFIRAFQRLDQLGPPWDFKSWLYQIASNLAIDYLRSEQRYVSEEEDQLEVSSSVLRPTEKDIEQEEQRQSVWKTLSALPTNYRQALVLREFNRFSYQEIGDTLQSSYENARQLVHRARLRFRDKYGLALFLAVHPASCHVLGDLLSAFQDGELDEQQQNQVQAHIAVCAECRETQDNLCKVGALLLAMPPFIPSATWKNQVLQQIISQFTKSPIQPGRTSAFPEISPAGSSLRDKALHPISKGQALLSESSRVWWLIGLVALPLLVMTLMFSTLFFFSLLRFALTKTATPFPSIHAVSAATSMQVIRPIPSFTLTTSLTATTSPTPIYTHTPTLTPSPIPTNTSSIPTAVFRQNSHCRKGPGMDYSIITSLVQGTTVQVDGRNQDSSWWWIQLPNSQVHCWVYGKLVEISGYLNGLPVITPPAKPTLTATPVQGCWVLIPNQPKKVCMVPCPPNAMPGGACTP